MRFRAVVVSLAALVASVSACAVSFSDYNEPEKSGSGGTGVNSTSALTSSQEAGSILSSASITTDASTSVSASTFVSASAGSNTSNSTSSSNASSSTGGQGIPLGNCGNVADSFSSFPGNTWQHLGSTSNTNGEAGLQITQPAAFAAGWIQATSPVGDECALTIELDDQPASGLVYIEIQESTNEKVEIDYTDSTHTVSAHGIDMSVPGKPDAIGIVLTSGGIHYIYRLQGIWHITGPSDSRPAWMNTGLPLIGFGVVAQQQVSASFDNFNIPSISAQDVGL